MNSAVCITAFPNDIAAKPAARIPPPTAVGIPINGKAISPKVVPPIIAAVLSGCSNMDNINSFP